ncbi:hypothetical protein JVT61DRAFT_14097 [Boletus reticuloceps]|uniref:P-loop containing nucleoside triphosphate hydrolase protein n=1 Tax=Boletus reticuloceps TaxID=495285 RepID=A0A8I2YVD3_9AGAM|nr:hypothetical protein JVT61DRAFT_14097 [Boletus reticuloceps]
MINLFAHFDRHPHNNSAFAGLALNFSPWDRIISRYFKYCRVNLRRENFGALCGQDEQASKSGCSYWSGVLYNCDRESSHARCLTYVLRGATCSGKTTLAKHFRNILPNSIIIHQDPEELIPIHPVHNVADWDAPQGAIDWPRLRAFLKHVKDNGVIPPDHRSHDHMNEQKVVPITEAAEQELRTRFEEFENEQRKKGIRVMWGLVDGFLLYWDKVTYCDFLVHGFLADSA